MLTADALHVESVGRTELVFVERLAGGDHEKPPNYERVIEINRSSESITMQEATELELGPNNCSA